MINPEYKRLPSEKLIPYARNSRTHSPEQVAQIAASIKEFGFTNPILIDEENGIIAGHGRLLAALLQIDPANDASSTMESSRSGSLCFLSHTLAFFCHDGFVFLFT